MGRSLSVSEVGIQTQKNSRGLEEPRDDKPRHPEVAVGKQLTATAQTHSATSLPEWVNAGVCEGPNEAHGLSRRRPVFTDGGPVEYTSHREPTGLEDGLGDARRRAALSRAVDARSVGYLCRGEQSSLEARQSCVGTANSAVDKC